MKKINWSAIIRLGLFVCISGIIGYLLLLIVYLLPVDPIKKNVMKASEELNQLGAAPFLLPDNAAARLDIYTDTIMLNEAVYAGNESVTEKAAAVYRYGYKDRTPFQSLLAYLAGEESAERVEYARYWHGYLIFLKPLLLLGTYDDVRALNLFVQMLFGGIVVMEMVKRKKEQYIICFLLGLYSLMPIAAAMCLQYAAVLNITLISCAILLKYYERLMSKGLMPFFYTAVGMAVCYFDLLTYPLVTLGFVLLTHTVLEKDYKSIKRACIIVMTRSLSWAFGYTGLWGIKWILASVFMGKNVIKEGILQILYRASTEASEAGMLDKVSRTKTILLNLETIITPTVLIAAGVVLSIMLVKYIRRRTVYFNTSQFVTNAVIAVMPFIWIAVTANHAYIHYWMVYRNFLITVFAAACIMISFVYGKDNEI